MVGHACMFLAAIKTGARLSIPIYFPACQKVMEGALLVELGPAEQDKMISTYIPMAVAIEVDTCITKDHSCQAPPIYARYDSLGLNT